MSDNPVPGVAALARDADIARIAAVLLETAACGAPDYATTARLLYDAGLRPSVEPAGLREAAEWLVNVHADDATIPRGSALWEDIQALRVALITARALAAEYALLPTQASDS